MISPHMRNNFLSRVRQGQPHTEHVLKTINDVADVGDMLTNVAKNFAVDRKLTPEGQRAALQEKVRTVLVREYARASRAARNAPAQLSSEKQALGLPKVDRSDLAAERRREEVRAALRALPEKERHAKARAIAADPDLATAILDAPPFLTGLDAPPPGMPTVDTFADLKRDYIVKTHGPKLEEIEKTADDYSNAVGLATAVRHELFQASGLTREGFEALIQPLEAECDR